ncbi:hypothetical protein MSHO_24060 [Mycobacterium shottsii]|uniref:Uncharacterized protein n=1 Tax=Mycobacterium shottsii TaxID=133549 RepID=A0A7I7LAJ5_9MYCO|nr:hypothetical protein MSHO_24060 [Mycobacterium shottsii]
MGGRAAEFANPTMNSAALRPNSATDAGSIIDCDIAAANGSHKIWGSWQCGPKKAHPNIKSDAMFPARAPYPHPRLWGRSTLARLPGGRADAARGDVQPAPDRRVHPPGDGLGLVR